MRMKTILTSLVALVMAAPAFAGADSGLKPGDSVTPFHPKHISGPLAGSDKCFPCTFQARPQVQVWVNGDDEANVQAIIKDLQANIDEHKSADFKAMVVVMVDDVNMKMEACETCMECKDVAVAVISKSDPAVKAYKINTDASVKNTVMVYKNWKVSETFVNFKADEAGCATLCKAIATVTN